MMRELVKTARIVGWKKLFAMEKAHRRFWKKSISGFFTTRVLQVLLQVGLFDALQKSEGMRPEAYALENDLDAVTLQQLCDYLYAVGLLDKENAARNGAPDKEERYLLSADGRLLVAVARGWFEATDGYAEVYHQLEAILRKRKRYGVEILRNPIAVAGGSAKMESLIFHPHAIEVMKQRGFRRVLDLGCGDGEFLISLGTRIPEMTAWGVDLCPVSIARATERLQENGIDDRILLFCQDMTKLEKWPELMRKPDMATLFFVLHELLYRGDAAVVDFLAGFRRIFAGVPLMIFEVIRAPLERTRKSKGMSAQYYLQHDLTHQRLTDRAHWHTLFRAAGFTTIGERRLKFAKASIFTLC